MAIKGLTLFPGYGTEGRKPHDFTIGGFFATGDLATVSGRHQGSLAGYAAMSVVDRKKDMILVGGAHTECSPLPSLLVRWGVHLYAPWWQHTRLTCILGRGSV